MRGRDRRSLSVIANIEVCPPRPPRGVQTLAAATSGRYWQGNDVDLVAGDGFGDGGDQVPRRRRCDRVAQYPDLVALRSEWHLEATGERHASLDLVDVEHPECAVLDSDRASNQPVTLDRGLSPQRYAERTQIPGVS